MTHTNDNKLSSFDAEQYFIGSVISRNQPEIFDAHGMRRNHFESNVHRIIFDACQAVCRDGYTLDLGTLTEALKERGDLDRVGGAAYLIELIKVGVSTANALLYAESIKTKAARRKVHNLLLTATAKAAQGDLDVSALVSDLVAVDDDGNEYESNGPQLSELAQEAEDRAARGELMGMPFGIPSLDAVTCCPAGYLTVIVARPGVGKTALLLSMTAANLDNGRRIGLISAEMPGADVGTRLAALTSGVTVALVKAGKLNDIDAAKHSAKGHGWMTKIGDRLQVLHAPRISIGDIEAIARKWKRQNGIEALYVDYLQDIDHPDSLGDDRKRVATVSGRLRQLAKELGLPIVSLAQATRAVDERENKIPKKGDIADSSQAEKDAAVILGIHREPDDAVVRAVFDKVRDGRTGGVPLMFEGRNMRFY